MTIWGKICLIRKIMSQCRKFGPKTGFIFFMQNNFFMFALKVKCGLNMFLASSINFLTPSQASKMVVLGN